MNESNRFPQHEPFNVLLIGDSCIDEYQYGNVNRISPEAPVPVFEYLYTETKPGMALNVKENFEALNTNVVLMTPETVTRKIRLIDLKTRHHILRVDKDSHEKEPLNFDKIKNIKEKIDAVVISDYDKGYVTYDLLERIGEYFVVPIFVDTKKKDLARIKNCFVKINEAERNRSSSLCDPKKLIVTLGSKGAIYRDTVYPGNVVEVTDVCGAGDTFLAALTYFTLLTGSIETAIPYANRASSISVQHLGTYAPTLKEIYET